MKTSFEIEILNFSNLKAIEGAFSTKDFKTILEELEVEIEPGFDENDIYDIFLMALQDLGPEVAAFTILKYSLGNKLKDSQLRNLAVEMLDEKLWEEYADLALHENFFNVGSLLYSAFPQKFPTPDAVKIKLIVTSIEDPLSKLNLDESFLVRALADGMDHHSVLHRLFESQLKDNKFPEADKIIWIVKSIPIDTHKVEIEIISSGYWLDPLHDIQPYITKAHSDTSIPNP